MGLAPYGEPKYAELIYNHLIDIKDDGSFTLNMEYFDYCTGLTMTNDKFSGLFGGPPRRPEAKLTQRDMDLARSVQDVTEEVVLRMAKFLKRETGEQNLCLAGGVALNCVANGKIFKKEVFENIWVQPAAGDAGGALGAALSVWHQYLGNGRNISKNIDSMKGAYLGPSYSNEYIESFLSESEIPFIKLSKEDLLDKVAELLAEGKVIGWFHGRMEFGPRALGARSIIGDARNSKMQSIMNLKIKYRESFRPFAPSVMREKMTAYFDLDYDSPYMLFVAPVKKDRCIDMPKEKKDAWGIELLNVRRSDIPAVTHVDYSARIQTVDEERNPLFYRILKAFEKLTGCGVLINTSFNIRGEPIVCSAHDSYRCFMCTDMDYLLVGNHLFEREHQPNKDMYKKEDISTVLD